jgi:3-methyl-2-oxobutanoate hydroxymethyltransferase
MSSVEDLRRAKGQRRLVMVTAYDTPSAEMAAEAGVDAILVGDSVAMVVLGHPDTTMVGMDEMVHHVAAVARAKPEPVVVADMPWLSYHLGTKEAVANAARLVRAGARAVKLEGGRRRLEVVRAILDAEIPVMGHIGLTPQSVLAVGGFRVQGRDPDSAEEIVKDAKALAEAGCFAIVIEAVPAELGRRVSEEVEVPTIGIGAGPHTDGQVLVFHDLVGLESRIKPRFVRRYAELRSLAVDALRRFADDVRSGAFPGPEETYRPGGPRR